MDKRQQRTQLKKHGIQQAALELFSQYGVEKVSIDEIAARANVSKVTLYKYFGSKDELYADVINTFIEDTLVAIEEVFDSDIDFLEKLKFALLRKTSTSPLVSWTYLLQVWEKDGQMAKDITKRLQTKVKALMNKLFEEGKTKGFIDENISFEMLYLYSEIFRAGIKAKSLELEAILSDKAAVEQLVNLHFFGFIKKGASAT